ncbi:hypothetical protein EJV46_03790 [Roseococcus sp. SYP-B2431]|uniref:hypothetical protein n=1 Tax=Roseococcus sp. SYP-B2431 TaxID=2496640 RepID=UPI001039D1B7|nr:hypothetical protein [Roseococcus sp. SYP-B2431]TCH99803.1 hypothetical protein EJV46_03790 [Roseococcus sp. SYP-B2431]
MVPEAIAGLLAAINLAAHAGLFGSLAFLAVVATPLAHRLPGEQSLTLTARTQSAIRAFALVTIGFALAEAGVIGFLFAVVPPVATLAPAIAGLIIFALVPRTGPSPVRAALLVLLAAAAMVASFAQDQAPWFGPRETAGLLAEAGLGLCLGALPALWMALRAPWPASVAQLVGARHLGLALPGLAVLAAALSVAWPHRALFLAPDAFPVAALTAALAVMALLALAARGALLALGSRAGAPAGWLPRLRVTVEIEMLLGLALAAATVSLMMAQPGAGGPPSLWPVLSLRAPGVLAAAGALIMLMAPLALVRRPRFRRFTRFGPVLLLPVALLLLAEPEGGLRDALAVLVLIAGLGEAWRLLGGERGRLALAPALLGLLGIMLVLAAPPSPGQAVPLLLAFGAVFAHWKSLRLPSEWERRAGEIGHAICLGAFGLLLILTHGGG